MAKRDRPNKLAGIVDPAKLQSPRRLPDPEPPSAPPRPRPEGKGADAPPAALPTMKDRLPAGSRKELEWDGQFWSGILSVPDIVVRFTARTTSEKRRFWALNDAYRAHLAAQEAKA